MIWGLLYLFSLLAVLVYVLRSGDRETRIAIVTLTGASLLTLLSLIVTRSRFDIFSLLVTSLDLFVLAIFLAHALASRRYWTLCLPAFQIITCVTHIAKLVAPEIVPRVYSAGQGFWAYPQLLVILLAAVWAHADRADARSLVRRPVDPHIG